MYSKEILRAHKILATELFIMALLKKKKKLS